jgi:DNA polymerase elongation subunit (family B)
MAHCTGWILDVSIEHNRAIIWIKTTEGNVLRLVDKYQPNFYVLPKDEFAGQALFQILSQVPMVEKVEWVQKFTDLFDIANHGIRRLISVYTKSINTLVKRLDKDTRVAQLCDTDLSPVQQYLFKTLKIEPTSKVEIEYDENTSRLIGITNIEEDTCMSPPFSTLYFDSRHDSESNQIIQIKTRHQDELYVSFEGDEENILKEFQEFVVNKDLDILIFTGDIFKDFITKMSRLGFDIGREPN